MCNQRLRCAPIIAERQINLDGGSCAAIALNLAEDAIHRRVELFEGSGCLLTATERKTVIPVNAAQRHRETHIQLQNVSVEHRVPALFIIICEVMPCVDKF